MILTSVVLACGLIVTVFSDLPSPRLFGWLSAFAMLAALAADLLILRPTVTFLSMLVGQMSRARLHRAGASTLAEQSARTLPKAGVRDAIPEPPA